jgi:predicted N-acetyltransferase YhbS
VEALIEIVRLEDAQDGQHFGCGNGGLNKYLKREALDHQKKHYSVTWVAQRPGFNRIIGYITLSMACVITETADAELFSGLPHYPMPTLLVGKLAVNIDDQNQHVGSKLLNKAFDIAIEAVESLGVGVHAVELMAIDEKAYNYYLKKGFIPLKKGTMRMYLPLRTLKDALKAAEERKHSAASEIAGS